MHELSGFEQVLAVALDDYAGPRRPVDAAAIARRAMAGRGGRMRPTSTWLRPNAAERRTLLRVALVAALLAIALITAAVIGSRNLEAKRPPSTPPSPLTGVLPTAPVPTVAPDVMSSTFSCAEAQTWSARKTTTWTAGPAHASPSEAENGWIAAWGGGEVPELFLIDPNTGASCRIARFETYPTPLGVPTPEGPLGWVPARGPLVWSPDGQALAFVVLDGQGARDLYVWSRSGLAGPLMSRHDVFWPGTPSWSPDGQQLASPDVSTTGLRKVSSVWILDGAGAPPRAISSGCVCHLGQVQWSPAGRNIATTTRLSLKNEEGIVAGPLSSDELQPVPIVQSEVSSAFTETPFGFFDEQTLVLANPSPSRFIGRRIDDGTDRDLGPTRVTGSLTDDGPLSLAPDRTAWLFGWPSVGVLEIRSGMGHVFDGGAKDGVPAGWAPNSRAVGYVNEFQGIEQGIWVANRDDGYGRRVAAGPYVMGDMFSSLFAWQPVWVGR